MGIDDHVDEDHHREIDQKRQPQGVAHHVHDRLVEFEGPAPVALQQPREAVRAGHHADPDQILLPDRPIEAVLLDQEFGLRDGGGFSLRPQLRDLVGQEVPRRQLDDEEDQGRDDQQGHRHGDDATQQEADHRRASLPAALFQKISSSR